MRELPPGRIFTFDEALTAGWTSSALKNAVRHGRIVRLRRGVYAPADALSGDAVAIAAAQAIPHAAVSHRSALLLNNLPLLGTPPPVPELTVAPRSGMNIPDVHIYRATLRPEDVVLLGEARVTSMPRTLADVARHRPVAAAVAAMDAALHRELVTVEEIQDVLRFCVHWPLVPRGWRALKLADGRAESPLESISRLLFPMLGLPVPNIQQTIFDRSGRLIGRADYYWDEFGVVGEADGRTKYSDRTVLTREKERQEEFEDLGLVVARWGWEHATVRRHVLKARLEQAFSRGRARDSAGFPRLWTL